MKVSNTIYTLLVPRGKIYVVNSPQLVAAIDRQPKTFSFAPHVVEFTKRITVPSSSGLDAVRYNSNQEQGAWGVIVEASKATHVALAPSKELDRLMQVFTNSLSERLGNQSLVKNDLKLFETLTHLVTRCSTDAIYGTESNPYKDPAVEAAIWYVKLASRARRSC